MSTPKVFAGQIPHLVHLVLEYISSCLKQGARISVVFWQNGVGAEGHFFKPTCGYLYGLKR